MISKFISIATEIANSSDFLLIKRKIIYTPPLKSYSTQVGLSSRLVLTHIRRETSQGKDC